MDIKSGKPYPGGALTNFAPYPFEFDGVRCNSMEGLLQSFKFDKPHIQESVCKLVGFAAKKRGQQRNSTWRKSQTLWWDGEEYDRKSEEYQELLDRAFDALSKNEKFQKALLATGESSLTHSIGKKKQSETVLTEKEFVSRLKKIRERLKEN